MLIKITSCFISSKYLFLSEYFIIEQYILKSQPKSDPLKKLSQIITVDEILPLGAVYFSLHIPLHYFPSYPSVVKCCPTRN